ncbi:hypothetical protein G5C60_46085 [Streptomyces sp. HC44]|uniref:Uncharacterized protein n=1 Tax=Streptomyces scabichelini TaxID=2711217 RepID=A0A6G4VLX6_9ACTN|nr:hypothetical protein [Streptomyces scabichelini]NGO14773.1 hypothetical protein [Streptomyces scabichelini]
MGYWGYYVVGRSETPLAELDALSKAKGMTLHQRADDGWQVWECPSEDGTADVGDMRHLAEETGAPALFGYVMDSDCVVIEAAAPESGAWTSCLAREAMAGYLGGAENGLTVEDYFLEPRDAADRAVAWAAESGRTVPEEPLLEVFTSDADPSAEMLFFQFLDRLGVMPM